MKCRIVVITDLHYSRSAPVVATRQGQWGAVLLRRTVERLNRYIQPDVVVVLGDLLDDPHETELLTELKAILDRLKCPWLAIPGNHDPAPATFYEIFPRVEYLDVNGVRLVGFADEERPEWNAYRNAAGFEQMARAAAGHAGPLAALQHVPVGEPRRETPYGYTNCAEVADALRRYGYRLALSGHYHKGRELQPSEGFSTMTIPALCEAPYSFALVTMDGDEVKSEVLSHQLPASWKLNDYHSHTQFAYCAEDVSLARSRAFAALMGVNQLAFTEHSGQLYFDRKPYWQCVFGERGIHETEGRQERMADYWREAAGCRSESVLTGLEADADYHGNLVAQPADIERADLVVGAVHWLPALQPPDRAAAEFLRITDRLCRNNIDVLAHPFRVFRRSGQPVPASLFAPVISILRETGVAAEINFHSNEPEPEFFAGCLRAGVKISFGSDAHALYEVGEFHPHLALLAEIGYDGDVHDILIPAIRI